MSSVPNISEAEWEVMKVLWNKSPLTAKEIIDHLDNKTDWKPKTIKTLISRLVKKEVLGFKPEGKIYLYYPLYKENECVKAEGKSFLNRIFGGSVKPMLAHFLEEEELSPSEIDELKKILEKKHS